MTITSDAEFDAWQRIVTGRDLGDLLANLRPAWMREANCRGASQSLFFQGRDRIDEGWRDVCADCVVRSHCLEYAMADPSMKGRWGGTTEADRRKLRTSRRAA